MLYPCCLESGLWTKHQTSGSESAFARHLQLVCKHIRVQAALPRASAAQDVVQGLSAPAAPELRGDAIPESHPTLGGAQGPLLRPALQGMLMERTVLGACLAQYHHAQRAARKWAVTLRAHSAVENGSRLNDAALFQTGPGLVKTIFTVAAEAAF